MKYHKDDKIIDTKLMYIITDDHDTLILFLNLALDICKKYLPIIKNSLEKKDKDALFKGAHEINGLSTIGLTAITNISHDLLEISENINYKLGKEYLIILEKEIDKFKKWIENFEKKN